MFYENLESVTRKIEDCFEGVYRVFLRSLKDISRNFQRWSGQVLGVLQECFKEIQRKLRSVLSASMMFYDCFKVSSSLFCVFFKVV